LGVAKDKWLDQALKRISGNNIPEPLNQFICEIDNSFHFDDLTNS
jgi:hypothetical protein